MALFVFPNMLPPVTGDPTMSSETVLYIHKNIKNLFSAIPMALGLYQW